MRARPERHLKDWGYEDWIVNNDKYCGKLLHFNKGWQCSLHYHAIKDETFYLASGRIAVEFVYPDGEYKYMPMFPGETLHILPGTPHRIVGIEDSDLFEFSTHHEETDSYRVELSRRFEW